MLDGVVSGRAPVVLGYGCRLPGAGSPQSFHAAMLSGRSAIGTVPASRWDSRGLLHPDRLHPGTAYSNAAGVLDDPFLFDAAFFGISPREAVQMDPQQRLLLQVAWEAVEMAGLVPARLRGPRTGVYVGASGLDYANAHAGDLALADAPFMTGNTLSIIANRLAHVLDAEGPSYVVDTACSSSLYAVHAACSAIRAGEIDLAVVGGTNMLFNPAPFIGFSRAGMISPSGRSRPFDADADGYVRAEGVVAFVLAGRDAALAAGDRIRGVVAASGINSDGRARALSVPNGTRQQALMQACLAEAGLAPDDLAFVEAHGTGTAVGDPIEAHAIGAAFGAGRSAPLPIGSVKSNIGHLEPASGLAGLLKAQLALEHGTLPPTLGVETPNPHIPFDDLNLCLATEPVALARRARPWAAGVNSFGFGGANAHVTLLQAEAEVETSAAAGAEPAPAALVLTAATETALKRMAAAWRDRLADTDADAAADLLAAAAHRRARHAHRLIVPETDPARLAGALGAVAEGIRPSQDLPRWVTGRAVSAAPAPVAFLFSGNGSQWAGMARGAFAADAAFRDGFEAVAAAVRADGGPDLAEALAAPDLEARLAQALVAQPLLIAVQVGLVTALAERGVRPAAVCGHSVGEVTAAWASGALSLDETVRLAMRRARRQAPLFGTGGMAAVAAGVEAVEALIAEAGIDEVAIAADNSPRGCTVSGPRAALEALSAAARSRRIALRRLKVEYPFHGPMMTRIEADLRADLADLDHRETRIPFFSTVTGGALEDAPLDAEYWWRNARQPVLFRQAVSALADAGIGVFLEIGPQPSLNNYIADTLQPSGRAFGALSSFRRQGVGAEDVDLIAAQVIAAGGAIDETPLLGRPRPAAPDLPAYPWDERPFAVEASADAVNIFRQHGSRPLLGWTARRDETVWYLTLDPAMQPWLADHRVDGAVVVPAAALAEIALAAGAEGFGEATVELADFDVPRPVTLDEGQGRELRTTLDPATGALRIEGRPPQGSEAWALHAQATVRRDTRAALAPALDGEALDALARAAEATGSGASDALYAGLAQLGLDYGPAFRRVAAVMPGSGEAAFGRLDAPAIAAPWMLDPTALDAAFHLVAAVIGRGDQAVADGLCHVPVRIARLRLAGGGGQPVLAQARVLRHGARTLVAEVALHDAAGACVALAEGVRFAAIALRRRGDARGLFWREAVQPLRGPGAAACLPASWAEPVERLRALGLLAAEDAMAEADSATLVTDAACRRIVLDAARALAPEGGLGFRARRLLAPTARRALERGLAALAEDGTYDSEADMLRDAPDLPPLPALLATLCAVAPERASAIAALAGLAARLADRQGGETRESASLAASLDADSAVDATLWAPLTAAAADLVATMGEAAPPQVAVLGAMPAGLAAALAGAGRLERAGGLATGDATALEAMAARGPVDVLLLGPRLSGDAAVVAALLPRLLNPGALVLGLAGQPDLLRLMLADLEGEDLPDLCAMLAAAGLDATTLPLAGIAGARLVVARRPAASASAPTQPRRIALLAGGAPDLATALAARLDARGHVARRLADAAGLEPGETLVMLPPDTAETTASEAVVARLEALRAAMRAAPEAQIVVVTRGAADGAAPSEAAIARALRVLGNERPERAFAVLDVCATLDAEDAAAALATCLETDPLPTEAVAGPSGLWVPRVADACDVADRAALATAGAEPALALATDPQGGIAGLRWRAQARRAPGPGEVEIAVRAAGLNFRDVMWAMGALPEEAIEEGFSGAGFGMEAAGVVLRAGAGVDLDPGTRVVAFAAGAMSTHVTLPAAAVAAIPDSVSFAAAASLPVAFATAWHGLVTLGGVQSGETVLVHGAVGGVGIAAIQIAKERGARVLATAGTPQRRLLAGLLGADAVLDSRSLGFAEGVMDATGGDGVDIVLNSLSGAAMERSLDLVKPFGRFVELGKRDYYAGTRIALRPLRRNTAYYGVDLDALLGARPDAARPLLREMVQRMADGALAPLPHRRFEADAVQDAVRLMQRAGHVGKIVVAPPAEPLPWSAAPPVRGDAAYLVVGGLGGVGLRIAENLAAQGARHLWLTGRRGVASDPAVLDRLGEAGVGVEAVACDAADEAAMRALLDRIAAAGRPLAGVVHAAMVLDDALFDGMDAARIAAVLRPKLDAAMLLDRLTRGLPVERFVLISSIAAMIGNPGQVAYVAANAGIEAVARARRRDGLPALAVALGPIADAGALADDPRLRERLAKAGAGLMTSAEALHAIDAALNGQGPNDDVLTVAPVRWPLLARDLPVVAGPLFERLDRTLDAVAEARATDIAELIAGKDDAAALAAIIDLLRAEAAQILRQPAAEIDPTRPLSELGFDSLMAVELKLAAEEKYRLDLPVTALSDGMTLSAVAARLLGAVRRGAGDADADDVDAVVASMARRHLGAEHGDIEVRTGDGPHQTATAEPAP